jgi:hypothetical protein
MRNVGSGRVIWGRSPDDILRLMNVPKDVEYGGGRAGVELAWLHRRAGETDIYYVANLTDERQDLEMRFRVANREAELWRPDTGAIEPASFTPQGGRTRVPLRLDAREMVFVVFPRPASVSSRTVMSPADTTGRHDRRRVACQLPVQPRRALTDHAPRPAVVDEACRRGRPVLLRHGDLHEIGRRATGRFQRRRPDTARSGTRR